MANSLLDGDTLDQIRQLAATGTRIQRCDVAGRKVWLKRHDAEGVRIAERFHQAISPLLFPRFWRASQPVSASGMTLRESRKFAAFTAAGIPVPQVVATFDQAIAVTDAGPCAAGVLKALKARGDAEGHDAILVRIAAALGRVHRAGLCHGRPHVRDIALDGDRVVFFDFEEEPETQMPLAEAQARDLWILFFHLTTQSMTAGTAARALAAYSAAAPAATLVRLRQMIASMRWMVQIGRIIGRIYLGADLRRFLSSTSALLDAFDAADHSPSETHPLSPKAAAS